MLKVIIISNLLYLFCTHIYSEYLSSRHRCYSTNSRSSGWCCAVDACGGYCRGDVTVPDTQMEVEKGGGWNSNGHICTVRCYYSVLALVNLNLA